jgi:hypothetical protein
MRFRPANISLINRRHYLPRLLLTLSSKIEQQRQTHESVPLDRITPYQRPLSCTIQDTREGVSNHRERPFIQRSGVMRI